MNKSLLAVLMAALVITSGFIPAVSALKVIYDEPITEYITTSKTGIQTWDGSTTYDQTASVDRIGFKDITKAQELKYLIIEMPGDVGFWRGNHTKIQPGIYDISYRFSGGGDPRPAVLELQRKTDSSGEVSSTIFTIRFIDWDIGSRTGSVFLWDMPFDFDYRKNLPYGGSIISETNVFVGWRHYDSWRAPSVLPVKITQVSGIDWKHHLRVEEHLGTYYIVVNGFIDGQHFTSDVVLKKGAVIHSQYENPGERLELAVPASEINILEIVSPSGTRYVYPLFGEGPYYPLRTVTVTMRDIDGNTISDFEVRAVNAVTGESYTVSTDTDVAYITLPMDRIATVPNPETGEYEEAPVGYYNFYGIKPGYKMVPDWAIGVNVLPEKYLPDVFCEFIVAPVSSSPGGPDRYPVTVYVYDAETRLPLSGNWDYYIVIQDSESVSGSASGPSTVVYLPETSILKPHLIGVTKDGYEQIAPMMFGVPAGGGAIHVYLTPLETVAPDGSCVVKFVVTDIETGTPVRNCLVNVDGKGKFAGASGTVLFVLPEHTTHQWVVTADGYWPIGGNFTLGVDDLTIPVEMTKKTSDLPRPPLPDLPNFPVVPPNLDPASFRMLILNVPFLGDMAEPLLDVIDAIAAGVDDIASSVLDFLTAPADLIVRAVEGISSQLVSVSKAFLDAAAIVLDSLGMLIAAIPTKVINLVTFAMILDIIILLLRGGL